MKAFQMVLLGRLSYFDTDWNNSVHGQTETNNLQRFLKTSQKIHIHLETQNAVPDIILNLSFKRGGVCLLKKGEGIG